MEMNIVESNRMIAEWMGYTVYNKRYPRNHGIGAPEAEPEKCMIAEKARYHYDWSWLMPVVEKIESIHDDYHGYFGVHICSNSCTIQGTKFDSRPKSFHPAYFADHYHDTKLLATYHAVVAFIQFYNQQKEK